MKLNLIYIYISEEKYRKYRGEIWNLIIEILCFLKLIIKK